MAGAANFGLGLMVMDYVMTSRSGAAEQQAPLWEVLFLLFGLIAVYFGSYCFRVFKRKRTITRLEIGQTLAVVLVGLGGAAIVIDGGFTDDIGDPTVERDVVTGGRRRSFAFEDNVRRWEDVLHVELEDTR